MRCLQQEQVQTRKSRSGVMRLGGLLDEEASSAALHIGCSPHRASDLRCEGAQQERGRSEGVLTARLLSALCAASTVERISSVSAEG